MEPEARHVVRARVGFRAAGSAGPEAKLHRIWLSTHLTPVIGLPGGDQPPHSRDGRSRFIGSHMSGRPPRQPTPPVVEAGRDLRLDFFPGLAIWLFFLDQLPPAGVGSFALPSYGFFRANEIFIFVFGYTAGGRFRPAP